MTVNLHVKAEHTLLKAAEDNVGFLHVDFPKKVHVRKAFYHLFLPVLWDRGAVCSNDELERSVWNVAFP